MKVNPEAKKLTAEVKETASKAGANLVGIVSAEAIDAIPCHWVGWQIQEYTKKTTEIMPDAKSVVVVGFHVWDDVLETALKKGDRWVYPGYFPLSVISMRVMQCLEAKGYKAVPAYSLSYKRLAQLAGFGNYGKNALIINPKFGPWIRLGPLLTNAKLLPDKPFEKDLCGDCNNCIEACPTNALTPYKVDDTKCLVGIHLSGKKISKHSKELRKYEPSLTKHSHLMCVQCQKVCKYGKEEH